MTGTGHIPDEAVEAAYATGFRAIRHDPGVWFDALNRATPAMLAAAEPFLTAGLRAELAENWSAQCRAAEAESKRLATELAERTRERDRAIATRDYWQGRASEAIASGAAGQGPADTEPTDSLTEIITRAREWSAETFGPGTRLRGVLDHIRKELGEIEANPTDVTEWLDVAILAFDGAWRNSGLEPTEIVVALLAKYERNRNRTWPDWRTMSQDQAIEHVRAAPAGAAAEPASDEKCAALLPGALVGNTTPCVLDRGHGGEHSAWYGVAGAARSGEQR